MTVQLWISSSAVDTDFTAKVMEVHPANEDYPEGFDMLLTTRSSAAATARAWTAKCSWSPACRTGDDHAAADQQPVRVGHRIRVDMSSSNWPRLDVNPNTGEPIGRHTHQVVASRPSTSTRRGRRTSSCR